MHSAAIQGSILICLTDLYYSLSGLSLWIFCLNDLPIGLSGALKSTIIILELIKVERYLF